MHQSKEKHRRSGHFGGADTARLVRLLGTNFTGPETAIRFRYQPPQEDQRTGGEAGHRPAEIPVPGVPANNIEAYLLGTVRSLSPELAAAYEDAFMRVEKSDLKHQHGRALTAKVRDLLKDRTGRDSTETADIVAGLYDDGYTDAVPTATPDSVTIDKKERELNAYQTQVYEKAWRKAVGGELDRLVTLNAFRSADGETQAKMLKKLYTYAGEMAKAAVFDDYEPKKFAGEYADAAKKGRSVAALVADELR